MKKTKTSNSQNSYKGYTVYESNQTYTSDDFVKSKTQKIGWFARMGVVRRIRFAFICLSILFFLIVGGIFFGVWFHYFNNYEQENLEIYSSTVGSDLRHIYMEEGCWNQRVCDYIELFGYTKVGIAAMLKDADGNIVTYSLQSDLYQKFADKQAFISPNDNLSNVKETEITLDNGEVIGYLNLWMYADSRLAQEDDFTFMIQTFFYLFIALVISLGLSVLFSFLLVKWLVKPVEKMVTGAKELGKGNFSHRVNMGGNDEFALMGKTFDDMARSIEKIQKTERSLTNDIAHELKTPLASMQATVEAIIDGVYEPSKERLNVVDLEIKRLSRLVEAILNLSRIENRKIIINKQNFDFCKIAKKCARFHQALFVDAGIEYEYNVEDSAYIYADKDLILQAITNLISNAFRYTKEGGSVKIYTKIHNNYVRFYVKDTGIGISDEDKEKLFMRFFRAKDAAKIEGCGSGVGLPIVKEIIDIHDGWIAVKSELGIGSCFIIGIPIVENKEEE